MAKLGIEPGKPFAFDKLDPAVQAALKDVPKQGFEKIMAHFKTAGEDVNGWVFTTKTGLYGTDYLQRALITAIGLGATVRRMRSIPPRKSMPEENPTPARTNTSCISRRVRCRQLMDSGR